MLETPSPITGTVTPPADLVGAARASLRPETFDALMRDTNGAPTPRDIATAADRERGD